MSSQGNNQNNINSNELDHESDSNKAKNASQSDILTNSSVNDPVSKTKGSDAEASADKSVKSIDPSPKSMNQSDTLTQNNSANNAVSKTKGSGTEASTDKFAKSIKPTPKAAKPAMTQQQIDQLLIERDTLSLMHKFSQQFSSTLDYEDLLSKVLSEVMLATKAEAASYWKHDPKTKTLRCDIAKGPKADGIIGVEMPSNKGIVGWCITNKKLWTVLNAQETDYMNKDLDKKLDFETKSMITVPLVIDNEAIAAIQIINKLAKEPYFTKPDQVMTEAVANQAAQAVKNSLRFEAEKKVKDLSTILKISKMITSTLDLDAVVLAVCTFPAKLFKYDRAIVALINKDDIVLAGISNDHTIDHDSEQSTVTRKFLMELKNDKVKGIILKNNLLKDHNKDIYKQYFDIFPEVNAFWATPLIDSEGLIGMMLFESKDEAFLDLRQEDILNILASQTTMAIRNALLFTQKPLVDVFSVLEGKSGSLLAKVFWSSKKRKIFTVTFSILLAVISLLPLPQSIVASCELIPTLRQAVFTERAGQIIEISDTVSHGALVKTGDLIARLDNRDLDVALNKKMSELESIQSHLRRAQMLGDMYQFQQYQIEEQICLLDINNLKLQQSQNMILAPNDGMILDKDVKELIGKSFMKGDVVVELVQNNHIELLVKVSEVNISLIQPGLPVRFTLSSYPLSTFKGVINSVETDISDDVEGSIYRVRAKMNNIQDNHELRVGMSGRAAIQYEQAPFILRFFRHIVYLVKRFIYF